MAYTEIDETTRDLNHETASLRLAKRVLEIILENGRVRFESRKLYFQFSARWIYIITLRYIT